MLSLQALLHPSLNWYKKQLTQVGQHKKADPVAEQLFSEVHTNTR